MSLNRPRVTASIFTKNYPSFSIFYGTKVIALFDWAAAQSPFFNGLDNHGLGMVTSALPSPQLGRLHRVAHQHGNGERSHAAGNGSKRASDFGDLGIDVADKRRAVLGKRRFPLRVYRANI